MRRRLCEAAQCIIETEGKIIDIAFKYQFNAPETFSRAFKRMFGLQPRQLKSGQGFDRRSLMGKPTAKYLDFLNCDEAPKPVAQRIELRQIVGIAAPIDQNDVNNTDILLWKLLAQEIESGVLAADKRDYYGLKMFSTSFATDSCLYLAGTSLMEGEQAPHSFVQKSIPAVEYACFDLSEHPNAAQFIRNYVYHTWWSKVNASCLPMYEIERFSDRLVGESIQIPEPAPNAICFPLANI
jgi:AraC family transcriptional regulator